jgi:serine/threonine protein kinase
MSLAQIGGVLEGVLAGLSEAERLTIVHRDLKPENLMITNAGGVKIADFKNRLDQPDGEPTGRITR